MCSLSVNLSVNQSVNLSMSGFSSKVDQGNWNVTRNPVPKFDLCLQMGFLFFSKARIVDLFPGLRIYGFDAQIVSLFLLLFFCSPFFALPSNSGGRFSLTSSF